MNAALEDILIVREPVSVSAVQDLAQKWYGDMIKGVADVEKGTVALGGDWHIDANTVLIADGSQQSNVWGFNIYVHERGDAALEYQSLINIRPAQGNRDMELQDAALRQKIHSIIERLIPELFV